MSELFDINSDASISNVILDQVDFMLAGGQSAAVPNIDQIRLYATLIQEEATEFLDTLESEYLPTSPADDVKEICDVLVVAAGYLISRLGMGGAMQAWNLVHSSNMRKVAGQIEKRADGKIGKGDEGKAERKAKLMADLEELL
jgi:hypothetical protein